MKYLEFRENLLKIMIQHCELWATNLRVHPCSQQVDMFLSPDSRVAGSITSINVYIYIYHIDYIIYVSERVRARRSSPRLTTKSERGGTSFF
jgi:hypothetical protein